MRISTFWMQQSAVNAMLDQQAQVSHTQLQVSTGRRILSPSDDPAGSAQALNLSHADAANAQYSRNIDAASSRLGSEDQTLSSVSDLLGRVRTLALEGANGAMSTDDRKNLATEIRQRLSQLVQFANTRDASGEYLFAGNSTRTQPFVQNGDAVDYAGDQGTRSVAIAPGQTLATGDPGSDVFQNIPAGNGYFAVSASPSNAGTLVAGATTMSDIGQWDRGSYQIRFTAPDAYEVVDASNAVVSSGSYASGDTISFRGAQVSFTGTPAAGDSYGVAPAGSKDMFSTLSDLASALESPTFTPHDTAALQEKVNRAVEGLDRASDRVVDVRARIGARLNTADDQKSLNSSVDIDLKSALSKIQETDYPSAISQLNLQMTGLQAAQQAYVKVQGLSLFDFLK
jgi:flagellar hook-associated protein 3 FlgL